MDIFPVSWCETNGYPLQHPCKPRGQCYGTNAQFQRTFKCCVHINLYLYLKWLDKILKFMFICSGETEKGCGCSARETVSKTQKCWNWVKVVLIMEKHSYLFDHSRVPSKDSSPDTTKQLINSSQAEIGECQIHIWTLAHMHGLPCQMFTVIKAQWSLTWYYFNLVCVCHQQARRMGSTAALRSILTIAASQGPTSIRAVLQSCPSVWDLETVSWYWRRLAITACRLLVWNST